MDNHQVTERGTVYSIKVDELVVTYLSGKDANARTPVFDMSVGEITLENTGDRSINLKYNSIQTFFMGHRFEFGTSIKNVYTHPRMEISEPEDFVDYNLSPGERILISRQDFMNLFQELGRAYFLDGMVCTRFEGTIQVDDRIHVLQFGPHCFRVELDRNWDWEQKRYLQFFKTRDEQQ